MQHQRTSRGSTPSAAAVSRHLLGKPLLQQYFLLSMAAMAAVL